MTEKHDDFERSFAQRYASYLEDGVRDMDTNRASLPAADQQRGRPTILRTALLSTATVAMAIVIVLVATRLLPDLVPPGTASGSPHPSAVPNESGAQTPSLEPTPSAAPSRHATADWPTLAEADVTVPSQLELGTTAFWTLETPLTVSPWTLRIGTLDGQVTREVALTPAVGPLDLTTIPQPVGPAGGRVLYVSDDGRTATLHVVDAATGDDRELASTEAIIPLLALDGDGSSAYYLANDRRTGSFGGVFQVEVDGGEPVVLIGPQSIQPVAATATLAAEARYFPLLAASTDGSMLAYASCTPSRCDVYSVYPGGDSILLHTTNFDFGEGIAAIVGHLLIGVGNCGNPPCDGFAIDLQTGERWPLGGAEQPFVPVQLIAGPHGPLALGQNYDYDKGSWQVEALDLTDRTRSAVFAGTFEPARTVVSVAEQKAAELPAGWFLIYRNADAAPDPYPDYSAATLGGSSEVPLPAMAFPRD
jgi:hypothetical protein